LHFSRGCRLYTRRWTRHQLWPLPPRNSGLRKPVAQPTESDLISYYRYGGPEFQNLGEKFIGISTGY
jgi:hypothetical protein